MREQDGASSQSVGLDGVLGLERKLEWQLAEDQRLGIQRRIDPAEKTGKVLLHPDSAKQDSDNRVIAVIDLGNCRQDGVPDIASRFAWRSIGGQPLIRKIIGRVAEAAFINTVVVTGAQLPQSVITSGIPGARITSSTFGCLIERLAGAADDVGASWVLYLPSNRPFVDPTLIDRLATHACRQSDCDYLGYESREGGWQRMDQLGLAAEICHADALRRLRHNVDRIHVQGESLASRIQAAPGSYEMRFLPVPAALDRNDLRFTIQSESDWDDAVLLEESCRGDVDYHSITNLLLHNQPMLSEMQIRNRQSFCS